MQRHLYVGHLLVRRLSSSFVDNTVGFFAKADRSNTLYRGRHWRCIRLFSTGLQSAMTQQTKLTGQFGSWKSPISSQLATESSVVFQEVRLDQAAGNEGTVYWSELRFDEDGRYVVCSASLGGSDTTQWTPSDYSARTRVHEYGGGALLVHNGVVYFSNYSDQRLYKQTGPGETPQPVTAADINCRYADGQFSAKHGKIFRVCEDHSVIGEGVKQPTNSVIVIDPVSGQQQTLVSGCDFYSSPRVSPDGKQLAWMQWDHPNMPWDSTAIMVANLNDSGEQLLAGSQRQIAGGQDLSVLQPRWTPDNQLLYISDQTDWWNIYHVSSGGEHVNLYPQDVEMGSPHWTFGYDTYDIDPRGSGTIAFTCNMKLYTMNLSSRSPEELPTGFEIHNGVQYSGDGHVYCNAGSPTKFPCIIRVNLTTKQVDIIKESRALPVDTAYLSVPRKISWLSANDQTSHGYFYPPQNDDYFTPEDSLPPLLVKAHGGPTANCSPVLDLQIQYFTSRGFAVLDVDYRGSTGYGKAYRHKLRKNWGVFDVEDCCSGALYLAKTKLVDGNRLCIDGGSAGGYTTLACLAFTDTFKAGASHYGVADVGILAAETHKFESRYLDSLIAPYNDANQHIFDARSPIKHIDKFSCPIAFFQGDEDEVVPPNQAEMMYEAVKAKGLTTVFVLFEGEQHGFRKAENLQKALDGEFYFFAKVFGFEPADKHITLDIVNLKE